MSVSILNLAGFSTPKTETKKCNCCKTSKDVEQFYLASYGKPGTRIGTCKSCIKDRNTKRRIKLKGEK